MSLDLHKDAVDAAWLVRWLATEAGVCIDPEGCGEPQLDIQAVEILYDVVNGLRVKDPFQDRWYRLRITAEPINQSE